ncbi:DEAH-box ATP-dependent RNA helicase prp22 [Savitreella phatthalungensis]
MTLERVLDEVYAYLGVREQVLGEYIVNQHALSSGYDDFASRLKDLPEALVRSLDRIIPRQPPAKKRRLSPDIGSGAGSSRGSASDHGRGRSYDYGWERGRERDGERRRPSIDEQEDNVDVELRDDEPAFLKGKTRRSLELSPIRVIRAPDGSLNRAAMSGQQLLREKRENVRATIRDPVRAAPLPTTTLHRELPIHALRKPLLEAVKANQMLIVVGETGSGKTTQLTQFLADAGFPGRIGCTQPRRVAATSVAKRVAEERRARLGGEVGYTVRFDDCSSAATKIKYLTDGMLQRECLLDPNLEGYGVIILDEAHERTIATDVLFGLLKRTCKRRPDLKLIITSATLDSEKFSRYFWDCPIFTIPGRTFPVEILHAKEPEPDYVDAALMTVMQIHLSENEGDILVFLTGQDEIETAREILESRSAEMKGLEMIVMPIYASLPPEQQARVFEPTPPGSRKIVLATNIAETSITIDGIYFVVDPGFVKQNAYDPKLGMDSLVVTPISQAQARQRAGRAGRTGPGKCFRLYTEAAFEKEMLPSTVPEIQRQNLSSTILSLKAMGINDLLRFDFMDPPPTQTLLNALEGLYVLGALDEEGLLTRMGRRMADFPMEPHLSKVLLASVDMGCSHECLTIIAMLSSGGNVFHRPRERQAQADEAKRRFHRSEGDHLTLLHVYDAWVRSDYSRAWCIQHFVNARALLRARDVRHQLEGIMERYKQPIRSCGGDSKLVRRAIVSGFFTHAAKRDPQEGYKTVVEGTPVYMHPSSALFHAGGGGLGGGAEWVVYHELVATTREYMHCVTQIEAKWLPELAPAFFKVADSRTVSRAKARERIVPLHSRDSADESWRISKQRSAGRARPSIFS